MHSSAQSTSFNIGDAVLKVVCDDLVPRSEAHIKDEESGHLRGKIINLFDPVKAVVSAASRTWRVSEEDLLKKSRLQPGAIARQVAMYALVEQYGWSYMSVSHAFGRHHTTIVFGKKNIKALTSYDSSFCDQIRTFLNHLNQYRKEHEYHA